MCPLIVACLLCQWPQQFEVAWWPQVDPSWPSNQRWTSLFWSLFCGRGKKFHVFGICCVDHWHIFVREKTPLTVFDSSSFRKVVNNKVRNELAKQRTSCSWDCAGWWSGGIGGVHGWFFGHCCCSEHTIHGSALGRQLGCLGRGGFPWSLYIYILYILGAHKKKWVGLSPKRISLFFFGRFDFTDFTSDLRLVALVARGSHPTLDTMHDFMVGSLWDDRLQKNRGPKFPGLGARNLKNMFLETQLVFCTKHSFFRFRTFRFSWASSTRTVAL